MFRHVQIVLLCGAMTAMAVGCYTETRRDSEAAWWETEQAPESQPTTGPALADSAQEGPVTTTTTPAAAEKAAKQKIRAIIETNLGHMEAELWPDVAPETVANFVALAKSGFYDNLPCHRMLPGFIVQLGKPTDPAMARALKPIKGEFSEALKHGGGTLSMARRPSDPDSATSQFFICFPPKNDVQREALASLNGKYAIFGKVVRGLAVLDQIEAAPTTKQTRGGGTAPEPSKPTRAILLRTVRIVE